MDLIRDLDLLESKLKAITEVDLDLIAEVISELIHLREIVNVSIHGKELLGKYNELKIKNKYELDKDMKKGDLTSYYYINGKAAGMYEILSAFGLLEGDNND